MDHVNRSRMEADAVEVATPVEIKNVTVAGVSSHYCVLHALAQYV